jgi:hypothetical protein
MPYAATHLALVNMAMGKRGVVFVLCLTLLYCALQPDFWRMMKGLWEYRKDDQERNRGSERLDGLDQLT